MIIVALVLGIVLRGRRLLASVALLSTGWALLVVADAGADFLGGLAFGAANAAFGAVLGVGLRSFAGEVRRPRGSP